VSLRGNVISKGKWKNCQWLLFNSKSLLLVHLSRKKKQRNKIKPSWRRGKEEPQEGIYLLSKPCRRRKKYSLPTCPEFCPYLFL